MKICDINPFIRFATLATFTPNPEFVYSYDSRLFYIVDGSGTIIIENTTCNFSPNDLFIWMCGKKYCFQNCNNLKMIAINFDFTQRHNDHTNSIFPVPANKFNSSLLMETDFFFDYQPYNNYLFMKDMEKYQAPLFDILNLLSTDKFFKQEQASSKFKYFLTKIAAKSLVLETSTVSTVANVLEYLKANFNKNVTNIEVGKVFGYHPNYINRLMLRHTGTTTHQYVIQLRIEKALELLRDRELSLTQISQMCGFSNVYYFSTYFKEKMGISPSTYRADIDLI